MINGIINGRGVQSYLQSAGVGAGFYYNQAGATVDLTIEIS